MRATLFLCKHFVSVKIGLPHGLISSGPSFSPTCSIKTPLYILDLLGIIPLAPWPVLFPTLLCTATLRVTRQQSSRHAKSCWRLPEPESVAWQYPRRRARKFQCIKHYLTQPPNFTLKRPLGIPSSSLIPLLDFPPSLTCNLQQDEALSHFFLSKGSKAECFSKRWWWNRFGSVSLIFFFFFSMSSALHSGNS